MAKIKYWNGTTWETLDAKDADTLDGKHAETALTTTEKNDLAGAINEVKSLVDSHKADNVSAHGGILKCVSGVASSLPIVVGFKPKFAFVVEMDGTPREYYFLAETAPSTITQIGRTGTTFGGAVFSNNGITDMYIKNKSAPLHYVIFG